MSSTSPYVAIHSNRFGLIPGGISIDGRRIMPNADFGGYGDTYYCDPENGDDAQTGLTPTSAVQTIAALHDLMTAEQNDLGILLSSSNAATPTTARVATGGTVWSKDSCHLIGVCSGNHTQQRARISTATTDVTTEIPLIVSADNCFFHNFSVFHGVNGWTGGTGEGGGVPAAVKVTGQRNHFNNVSISGLGDSTGANSMDVDGGSSLWLAESENLFEHCYIGLDTVGLGATVATAIQMSGAQSRNLFDGCKIVMRATAAGARLIELAASAVQDIGAYFDNCMFTNSGIFTGGAASTGVFEINATQNGGILVNGSTCAAIGFTFWEEATVSGKLYISNPAVGAGKAGLSTVAVGS